MGSKSTVDWTGWDQRIGTMADAELARLMGLHVKTVRERRHRLGIPMYDDRFDWSQWDHLLGQVSDVELARRIGTTRAHVLYRRQRLKIPSCPRASRKPVRNPDSAPYTGCATLESAKQRPDVRSAFDKWAWAIVERDRIGKVLPDSLLHQRAAQAVREAKAEALRLERTKRTRRASRDSATAPSTSEAHR